MTDQPPTTPPSMPPPPSPVPDNGSPTPDTQPAWWRRRFAKLPVWAWGGIAAVIAVAVVANGADDEDAQESPPAAETTVADTETTVEATTETTDATETTEVETTTTLAEPTTTVAETTTTEAPEPGFGGGTLLVGVDVEPGVYATTVPGSGFGCYWARLSDLSGDLDGILANDNVSPGAQALVEILPTDEAFESSGCGQWTAPELFDPLQTEIGEGAWIVGAQIASGRYRSSGPGASDFGCYWARLSGLDGTLNSVISNGFVDDPTIVDIAAGDAGFESSGCGTWTLVE